MVLDIQYSLFDILPQLKQTGLKECSREEAFDIIQGWAKEFAEEYGNCDFDGSYYDEIDEFIDKKLGTI